MTAYQRVLDALSAHGIAVRAEREQQTVRCPAHEDKTPSLSIGRGHDRVLIECKAGCTYEEVLAAIGLKPADLFDAPRDRDSQTVAEYSYVDESGDLIFQCVRLPSKRFRQRRPDGRGGWIWKTKGVRKVLYQLPRVTEAVASGDWVVIVEGEKDADRLQAEGFVATTSPMGAGKWHKCETSVLNDASIAIIPDNDDAGRNHAQEVAADLHGRASTVRIVALDDVPPKGDVSTWLDTGGNASDLWTLIKDSPEWVGNTPFAVSAGATKPPVGGSRRSAAGDLRFNDSDNSTRFVELHGERIRFVDEWGCWIVWDGTRWAVDRNRVAVSELAKDVASDLYRLAADNRKDSDDLGKWARQSATKGRIDSMVCLARGIEGVLISVDQLDTDPWLIGVANGYINLRTGTFHEPDPTKLMTMQAPVAYDPNAEAPRWTRALEEWFPDPEVRAYLQRLSGHALSGDPLGDHIFVIHHGDGRNGKGTCMRVHKHVLGPYYVTPDKSLLIQKRHDEHATVKARLHRRRLAVASETDQPERLNEAQVKNLTGRDPINARRMRQDEWEFEPTHSLWLQTNYLPQIRGSDTGIWSRIKIVPWTVTFNGHSDPDLDAHLTAEAPGILNWMIQGCLDWQADGLNEPDAVVRATLDYRSTEDVLSRFAADVGVEFVHDGTIIDAELKASIANWAACEGVDEPDAKKINAWLRGNGCRDSRQRYTKPDNKKSKRKIWKGAQFMPEGDQPETLDRQG